MTNRITKIAAAAVIAALVLPASQAFAASKTENALIGGAIGALAGALLGHGDTGAVVGGAAVGALVGVATDKPDRYGDRNRAYRSTGYRTSQSYRGYAQPSYQAYAPAYRSAPGYGYQSANSYSYAPAGGYGYAQRGHRYGY